MNFAEKGMLKLIKYKVAKWFELEKTLTRFGNVYRPAEQSPEKSWPDPKKIESGSELPFSMSKIPIVGGSVRSSVHQGEMSIKSIQKNPRDGKKSITNAQLSELLEFAEKHGIGAIGFTKVPPNLIFKQRAILYDNAMVLTMEMDKAAIIKAPSPATFKMVMATYDKLGIVTNLLTDKLRKMGFAAQASHPLGGLVLYPPLAVKAGLGWFGRHGLLITPQFGPRQRLSAIFVSADNLPMPTTNEHSWIGEFCKSCGKCIRTCPGKAILDMPVSHDSGRKTHILRERCLPVFVKQDGCTVCVKECMFTEFGYDELRQKHCSHR